MMLRETTEWRLLGDLHEANDSDDFDDREDELSFTVAFHAKHIDENDDEEEDGDKDGPCQSLIPVRNGQRRGNNLQWQYYQPLHCVAMKGSGQHDFPECMSSR